MRAAAINGFGGAERIQIIELPMPTIQPHEVLIEVKAAGIGMWDVAVRENRMGLGDEVLPFPVVLGWECAGIVCQVGAEVTGFEVGDAVYGYAYQQGTYAEYVAAPVDAIAHMPTRLSFVEAAAVPVCGVTAHQAIIEDLDLQPGETVLITAGAGGTGIFAIPTAVRAGAHVIATASARNHDLLRRLGAHEVIDYTTTEVVSRIREVHPDGIDAVLECVDGANFWQSVQTLRQGGRIASIVTWDTCQPLPPNIFAAYIIGRAEGERLHTLARLIDEGALSVHVESVFPLVRVQDAHRLLESRHLRGKIVLNIAE